MTREPTDIEVEVVEIDGEVPAAQAARPGAEGRGDWQDWRSWHGRVRRLDSRWWPLWVLLGIMTAVLLVTVGLVLGVLFLVARGVMKILRAVLG
ncbi:MAG: hypothetical protein WCJ14_03280 [Verrucomicrobiota bacterium]